MNYVNLPVDTMGVEMWFCKRCPKEFSVCAECGVHFEPAIGFYARWGSWCHEHRKRHMDADMRRNSVLVWAGNRVDLLYPMMLEDQKKNVEQQQAYSQATNAGIQNMAAQGYGSALGGVGRQQAPSCWNRQRNSDET